MAATEPSTGRPLASRRSLGRGPPPACRLGRRRPVRGSRGQGPRWSQGLVLLHVPHLPLQLIRLALRLRGLYLLVFLRRRAAAPGVRRAGPPRLLLQRHLCRPPHQGPCNHLLFGLGAKSPLWLPLNHGEGARGLETTPQRWALCHVRSHGESAAAATRLLLGRSVIRRACLLLLHGEFDAKTEQASSFRHCCLFPSELSQLQIRSRAAVRSGQQLQPRRRRTAFMRAMFTGEGSTPPR